MKTSRICAWLLVVMLANGCVIFHRHRAKPARPAPANTAAAPAASKAPAVTFNPIVTPDNSLTARVASYNSAGRFVVLTFPVGRMPSLNQTMFLYRAGLKVGEIKITGPQRDNDIVADIVTGTARVGDEVRDQ